MSRGERVARVYVTAVLVLQALVTAVLRDSVPADTAVVLLVASLVLLLPLAATDPSWVLRGITVWPSVAAALVWAGYARPVGTLAWVAWAGLIVWLCHPAPHHAPDTLAERHHARTPRHGAPAQ